MSIEIKDHMIKQRALLKEEMDRLQTVYDSEECKSYPSGSQKRILKQLMIMHTFYEVLGHRIAEEEFY